MSITDFETETRGNPVDLVVGNPPWLALREIQEAAYQERVTQLALDYGLLEERRGLLFSGMAG